MHRAFNSNSDETQSHILECKPLIGQSKIVTYLPYYKELYEEGFRSPDLCFKNSQKQPQQDKAAVTTSFVPNCR